MKTETAIKKARNVARKYCRENESEKVYIIEFRNSEGKRDAQCYAETTIKEAFDAAYKYCRENKYELIGVREA